MREVAWRRGSDTADVSHACLLLPLSVPTLPAASFLPCAIFQLVGHFVPPA